MDIAFRWLAALLTVGAVCAGLGDRTEAAPILQLDAGGQLMGARGVSVSGTLYNVEFMAGTCIDLFNGCDDPSDFAFQTLTDATTAGQALLDQVFLDVASGMFDADPSLTFGCSDPDLCRTHIPYAFLTADPGFVDFADVLNQSATSRRCATCTIGEDGLSTGGRDNFVDLNSISNSTYAVFSPVPEPSSLLLLGSGLAGLAGWRRYRESKLCR